MLKGETRMAPSTPTASIAATIWSPVTRPGPRAARPRDGRDGCVRRHAPERRSSAFPASSHSGVVRPGYTEIPRQRFDHVGQTEAARIIPDSFPPIRIDGALVLLGCRRYGRFRRTVNFGKCRM